MWCPCLPTWMTQAQRTRSRKKLTRKNGMTTSSNPKISKRAAVVGTLALLGFLVALTVYGYTTGSSNALATGLKKILPVVIIDGNTLSIRDIEENLQIIKKLEPNVAGEFAYSQLIERTKAKILAADLGLEWEGMTKDEGKFYTNNRAIEYRKLLDEYFFSDEAYFYKYVLEPRVIEASLRIHYNSDYQLNSETYMRAEAILQNILNGADFEAEAREKSEDKQSGQLGGDLGFFRESELLPELENQIQQGSMGQVQRKIFTSRLGYHIIWPVETAEKDSQTYWHAKHVLVLSSGFDEWLDSQLKEIKVFWIIK